MPPMGGGPRGRGTDTRKPKDTKATIARLLTYIGRYKVQIGIAFFFVILRLSFFPALIE